jgi:hypothetical protein
MEKEPINSEEYLSKVERIELKNLEGNFEESLLRISQPFKNFEIKEDGLEISEGEVKIEIKYAPHTYIRDGEKYVAAPGGSNHGSGRAADIHFSTGKNCSGNSDIDKIFTEAGWERYINEGWHFEYPAIGAKNRCTYPNCPKPSKC